MNTLDLVAVVGIGVLLLAAFGRAVLAHRDRVQFAAKRARYGDERRARTREAREGRIRKRLGAFFPYLDESVFKAVDLRTAVRQATAALAEADGTLLGTTEFGIPFKLLSNLRTRHVQIWARSGAGKSVIMMHLIRSDLRTKKQAAVVVICPEPELHREILAEETTRTPIYFAPGDRRCPVRFNVLRHNPGDDVRRHASEIFSTIKSCMGDTKIGPRADPLLANAVSLAMTDPNGTLVSVQRVLIDNAYRNRLLNACDDKHLVSFWAAAYESIEVAARPVLSRLDGYLRSLRHVFEHPVGSFTMREVVSERRVLLLDTSGLSVDDAALVTGLVTTMLRIELFRREASLAGDPPPVRLYVDEWPAVLGRSNGTIDDWTTVLSRSRKYNCGVVVSGQFPAQVPIAVRNSVAGNVSTFIALGLGAKGSLAIKHELLRPTEDGQLKPIDAAKLVQAPVGEGYARVGPGACAVRVRFNPPKPKPESAIVERNKNTSWERYAAPAVPERAVPEPGQVHAVVPSVGTRSPRPKPRSATLSDAPTVLAGRGGAQHKGLQAAIRTWGEECGFRADLERDILGGMARVDVLLEREGLRIAVEVCLTNTTAEVAHTVTTCLSDGLDHVVIVVPDESRRDAISSATKTAVLSRDRGRVHVVIPNELRQLLSQWSQPADAETRVAGYRIRIDRPLGEELAQRHAVAQLVRSAFLERDTL